MKKGIRFHPKSPYYSICADVVVDNVTVIAPHVHSISRPFILRSARIAFERSR